MKTRIVWTKIWEDGFFANLPAKMQLLFIYLATNSVIGLTGIYEMSDRKIRFDTKMNQGELDKAKTTFQTAGKIAFFNGWIYVLNAQKLGGYYGEKLNSAINKELTLIPLEVLKNFTDYAYQYGVSIPYQYTSHTPINHKSEIINDKSKTINQKEENITKEEKGLDLLRETAKKIKDMN